MPDPSTPDPGTPDPGTPDSGAPDPGTPGPTPATDVTPAPDYDEHGTPSLDHVRDRIESRYATALGATELAENTDRARDQADQQAERDRRAAERLDEIRRSLG